MSAKRTISQLLDCSETPIIKRPKISDPSISLGDACPFLQLDPVMIDYIFCWVTDIPKKMKLELVCAAFNERVKRRSSWKYNNEILLEFGYSSRPVFNHPVLKINGEYWGGDLPLYYRITEYRTKNFLAPQAFDVLLKRITVKRLVICGGWELDDDKPILKQQLTLEMCGVIARNKNSFSLDYLQFKHPYLEQREPCTKNSSWLLTALGSVGSNLTMVRIGTCIHWYPYFKSPSNFSDSFGITFWPFLSTLNHLRVVHLDLKSEPNLENDQSPSVQIGMANLRFALMHASNIKCLRVKARISWSETEMTHVLALCNQLSHLEEFKIILNDPTDQIIEQFTQGFNEQIRKNIRYFGINLLSLSDVGKQFVRSVIDRFPNITRICFGNVEHYWDDDIVIEVVGHLLHSMQQRGIHFAKLHLPVTPDNRWAVIERLTKRSIHIRDHHTYQDVPPFLVDDGKFDKITVKGNSVVNCKKGQFQIKLDMD